jgi:hypothetical protein
MKHTIHYHVFIFKDSELYVALYAVKNRLAINILMQQDAEV